MLQRLRSMKDERGFTLIELLIVIVILGILAAIVVFAVGGITDRGQVNACKTDKKALEVAEEAYFAQHSSDYATMSELVPQYIHEASTIHTITGPVPAATNDTSYSVAAVTPPCASGT